MSDDKNVKVDPRFDPAFQRGFDQSIPIEEYVPEPAPRAAEVTAPVVEPRKTEVRRPEPPVVASKPEPSVPELITVDGDDEPETAAPAAEADLDSSPSRNPFLLFLLVIAIALVAVGIWLFVRAGDAFNSREVPSQGAFMSLTSTITMAPFIALLGAATAIGVLFVFAIKWRRRR